MNSAALLIALISSLGVVACGDGTIHFGGDSGGGDTPDKIVIEGNIRDINPQVAGADIVVFVYTDLDNPPPDGTPPFTSFKKQRSVRVTTDAESLQFRVTQVESGNLTILFLQDDVGDPDGTIDPGDPYARFTDDPNNVLKSVRSGETLRLTDVDIDFSDTPASNPEGGGTADAIKIESVRGADSGQQ